MTHFDEFHIFGGQRFLAAARAYGGKMNPLPFFFCNYKLGNMDVLRKNQKWVSPLPVMVLVALCFGIIQCSAGNPKTAAEYLETANIHLDNKEYARAIEPLTKSIELDPANPDAWNSRAYAYYFLQDFEKAIADYTETLRLEPEMGVAWVFRAQAYTQLGEHEKAAADMKTITSLIEAQKAENQIISH